MTKSGITARLIRDAHYRALFFAVAGLIFNLLYAFYNGALGYLTASPWFCASCVYYLLLCSAKFLAIVYGKRQKSFKVLIFTGALLTVLSVILTGILYISLRNDTGKDYGTIPMITIAAYTFTKLSLAIVKAVKNRNNPSPKLKAIRCIGYSEVAVSVYTMQMSMLKTFDGMKEADILLMNAMTGTAACLFVLVMGILSVKKGIVYGKVKHSKGNRKGWRYSSGNI